MNFSKNKILTVAPFTKRLGFAVFGEAEMLYFAVKTFKPPRTVASVKAEISQSIRKLTAEFKPKLVIIKTLSSRQEKSKNLSLVFKQIKREAESRKLPVKEISFEQVKQELCPDSKATKAVLFKRLSAVYPELSRFASFQNPSQAEYYNSLFSAAAIGFYWQNKTRKSKQNLA